MSWRKKNKKKRENKPPPEGSIPVLPQVSSKNLNTGEVTHYCACGFKYAECPIHNGLV